MTDQVNEAVAWMVGNPDGTVNPIGAIYHRKEICQQHIDSYDGKLTASIIPLYTHPSRGVVDEVALAEVIQDHTGCGDSDSIYAAHAVIQHLQAAALPAVPDAGANGAAFNVGDRVVWTSRFGREFPGVIESVIQPVPTRYTVSLDDGCHADCDAWNLAATPAHDQPEGGDEPDEPCPECFSAGCNGECMGD